MTLTANRAMCAFAATLASFAFTQTASAEPFKGAYGGIQAGMLIEETEGSTLLGPFEDSSTRATASLVMGARGPISQGSPIIVGVEGDFGAATDDFDLRYGISGIGGVRLGERALGYARVGYASLGGVQYGLGSHSEESLVLGAGVEVNVTGRVNLRLDYRRQDFGTVANVPDNIVDLKTHDVTAGLILDF